MPLRVAIATIGCRANQADSAWLARKLDPKAVEVVPFDQEAELYIVNSCAVTKEAERDVRRAVHRARRLGGQEAAILLTGCMVTACGPERLADLEPLWSVVESTKRQTIPTLVHTLARERSGEEVGRPGLYPVPDTLARVRPSLRVQDGCSMRCAYCAVPAGRGKERSLPLATILERLAALKVEGAREVVVCGINLGAWGRDLSPKKGLAHLLAALEADAPVDRLRLSSIEPWFFDDAAVEVFVGARRIVPHLHLPLQSGDNGVLRKMGRPYKAQLLRDLAQTLIARCPNLALGTDVIAGFPAETSAAFDASVEAVRSLPLAYLHAFGFSPRPGTRAATMAGQLPTQEVKARVRLLREVGSQKRQAFLDRQIGRELLALFEPPKDPASHRLRGVTESYVTVTVEGSAELAGQIRKVRAERVDAQGLVQAVLVD